MTEAKQYLLVKRGLYYRPNNSGYTALKSDAGRYPLSRACPDAGITAVHEDLADEYAPATTPDQRVIWTLRAENKRLREALRAFADFSESFHTVADEDDDEDIWFGHDGRFIRCGDIRAARAALEGKE